jgi:hypothetical protein
MSHDEDEAKRTVWAQAAAEGIIDDVLAARTQPRTRPLCFVNLHDRRCRICPIRVTKLEF